MVVVALVALAVSEVGVVPAVATLMAILGVIPGVAAIPVGDGVDAAHAEDSVGAVAANRF